jgi:hypothetical protein
VGRLSLSERKTARILLPARTSVKLISDAYGRGNGSGFGKFVATLGIQKCALTAGWIDRAAQHKGLRLGGGNRTNTIGQNKALELAILNRFDGSRSWK